MSDPLIGITAGCDMAGQSYSLKESYAESIVRAGGIPLLLPADERIGREEEYAAALDGILFAGGGDIHPMYFKEEPLDGFEMGVFQPGRDAFEIRLYQEAEKRGVPMLGICRGIQLMAVAAGGSIYQDIDTGIKRMQRIRHMQKAPDFCGTHTVRLAAGSRIAEILQAEQVMVNSFHHQAVKELPECYRMNAWSADGVIEGIESLEASFCIGVQWHPERSAGRDKRMARLFQAFITAAGDYHMEKGKLISQMRYSENRKQDGNGDGNDSYRQKWYKR